MLTQIIKQLQSKVASLSYLEEVHGLAEIIIQQTGTLTARFPCLNKNSELIPVDFDTRRTRLFFLQDGEIKRRTFENSLLACSYRIAETFPLRIILYKQGKEDINCHSSSQQMAWDVAKVLTGKQTELIEATGLDFALVSITAINLDKHAVWKTLYTAPDALKESDLLIEIKFTVETEGDEACFVQSPCAVPVQGSEDGAIIQTQGGSLIAA